MTAHGDRVLFACGATPRAEALAELLRSRGCEVERVATVADVLAAGEAQALVVDEDLAGEGGGLGLCEELRDAGVATPLVLCAGAPDLELVRRADRLGVLAVIRSYDPRALVDVLERCSGHGGSRRRHFRSYSVGRFCARRAVLDLSLFLEAGGVAPAHRLRVLCAVAELIDNVQHHAYPDAECGSFSVSAEIARRAVNVAVVDAGTGFDADRARLDSVPAALPARRRRVVGEPADGGLARAARLSETLAVASDDRGSTVELAFELTPSVVCDDGAGSPESVDVSHPRELRALVASLREGDAGWRIPPALALTVDRLLGGARGRGLDRTEVVH